LSEPLESSCAGDREAANRTRTAIPIEKSDLINTPQSGISIHISVVQDMCLDWSNSSGPQKAAPIDVSWDGELPTTASLCEFRKLQYSIVISATIQRTAGDRY
jgi:hypothetical protein